MSPDETIAEAKELILAGYLNFEELQQIILSCEQAIAEIPDPSVWTAEAASDTEIYKALIGYGDDPSDYPGSRYARHGGFIEITGQAIGLGWLILELVLGPCSDDEKDFEATLYEYIVTSGVQDFREISTIQLDPPDDLLIPEAIIAYSMDQLIEFSSLSKPGSVIDAFGLRERYEYIL